MKQITTLQKELTSGKYTQRLSEIYGDAKQGEYQTTRYIHALNRYTEIFGADAVELFSAPGRTEIGGNHTDHQNGMVLAASVNLDILAVVGRNTEPYIHILSEGYAPIVLPLDSLEARKHDIGTTCGLLKGVTARIKELGYQIGPFRAFITSDVPGGAGLSSSAAFEVLLGTIHSYLFNKGALSPIMLAQISQYAENVYFGKPCGLMDQMACSVGGMIHIDFCNPQTPVVKQLNYDIHSKGYSLCIVDTKGSHADLTDDYAAIPQEMKSVAAAFSQEVLSQVDENDFYKSIPALRRSLGDRAVLRAIHFFQENRRVQEEVTALQEDDFPKFLTLFGDSANSSYKYLQNVYSDHDLTNQAIPIALALSELILGEQGICRIHGGGFAGTIQVFVKTEFVQEYKKHIEDFLGENTCHILNIRRFGGIKVIE